MPSPTIRAALASPDPPLRARALLLAAPLAPKIGADPWLESLRSPHADVRRAAASAFLRLPQRPHEPLVRAIAAETRPELLQRLLAALGHAETPPVSPFLAALDHPHPQVRAGACRGLAVAHLQPGQIPHAALARQLQRGPTPQTPTPLPAQVRAACAHALAQLPVPTEADAARALTHDLDAALDDPDPEVRHFAARALLRYPDAEPSGLRAALNDRDWRVASAAYRAYAVHAEPRAYDEALAQLLDHGLAQPAFLAGSGLRVWEAALRAALRLPSDADRLKRAEERLTAFADTLLADQPTPSLAAAHCELAAWVDGQRRWPGRLRACGDGFAPPQLVYFHEARLVAAQPSDVALRAHYLARMLARGPEARAPALSAARRAHHSSLVSPLVQLVRDGSDADVGRSAQLTLELSPSLPRADPEVDALARAFQERLPKLPEGASVATLVASLEALTVLDPPSPPSAVLTLVAHPSPDVAAAARRRLAAQLDPSELPSRRAPQGLPPGAFFHEPVQVELRLPNGKARLEIRPEAAPTASARLLAAIRAGWLEGATLGVRSSPPELLIGDAFASVPSDHPLWIRPNFSPAPCQAGSVLLVPAAADSDSLALRVLLSRRPELDGRATQVGRVTEGLGALAAVVHGQAVLGTQVQSP